MKLLNALSLNMINEPRGSIVFNEITRDESRRLLAGGFESAVGHEDTAAVIGDQLGIGVPINRTTVALQRGDRAIVAQYRGPRLAAGATRLPADAAIAWYMVEIA